MKLVINSPLDYTNHIRSLINKYWLTTTEVAKGTGLKYVTISRIQTWQAQRNKWAYTMRTDTLDAIIKYLQKNIGENIEIVYNYSVQKEDSKK